MAQVAQERWGNTLWATLLTVGIIALALGGFLTAMVPRSSAPLIIGWLLAGYVPQMVTCIAGFRSGQVLVGTVAAVFANLITLGAAFTLLVQFVLPYYMQGAPAGSPPPPIAGPFAITSEINGFAFAGITFCLFIFAIGMGRISSWIMSALFLVTIAFVFATIWQFQGAPDPATSAIAQIAGWLLLVFALGLFYFGTAGLLADHFQKEILPMGKPAFK